MALGSVATAEAAIRATVEYVKDRKALGTTIASFQNTKFELAACETDAAADDHRERHRTVTITEEELRRRS